MNAAGLRGVIVAAWAIVATVSSVSCEKDHTDDPDEPVSYTLTQSRSAKRGVSFNFGTLPDTDIPLLGDAVCWSYDWSNRLPSSTTEAFFREYEMDWCPMAWNGNYSSDNIRTWKREHPEAQYILAFNEPNLTDQARMTPAEAAALWPDLVALAKETGMKLISPAMNYGTLEGYHDPIVWLDEFFAQPGVSLDDIAGIAVHCYMPSAGSVKNFIDMFEKYGKPVWLTEFCNGNSNNISATTQLHYMCETLNMLEAHPNVFRYAWFMPRGSFNSRWNNNLLTSSAPFGLTDLGKVFVNFSTFDGSIFYGPGDIIPAEQYISASGKVHLAPSTDGGILDISELCKDAYVEYQLDMPDAGTRRLTLRFQTYMESSLAVSVNGTQIAAKTLASTEKAWKTAGFDIDLPAGKSTLRLTGTSGATIMLNWLQIK